MPFYELRGIGVAILDKNLECDFAISADDFFERFFDQTYVLSAKAQDLLRAAINSGKRQGFKKARETYGELDEFFKIIQAQ